LHYIFIIVLYVTHNRCIKIQLTSTWKKHGKKSIGKDRHGVVDRVHASVTIVDNSLPVRITSESMREMFIG
jgi:hypothetical protein